MKQLYNKYLDKLITEDIVKVPLDLMQPIQLGVCSESMVKIGYDNNLAPLKLGLIPGEYKFALIDGHHTGCTAEGIGLTTFPSQLIMGLLSELIKYYQESGLEKELKQTQQDISKELELLPDKIALARSKGIYTLKDLGNHVYESSTRDFALMQQRELDFWLSK